MSSIDKADILPQDKTPNRSVLIGEVFNTFGFASRGTLSAQAQPRWNRAQGRDFSCECEQ